MPGIITTLEASERLHILGETLRPLLTADMGSSIEIFDTTGPADCGPPPHQHPWEEIYVVLAGTVEVIIEGSEPQLVATGGVAHVPADTVHGYRIAEDETRFLTIFSQGNAASFFTQVAADVEMNPPDIPALVDVAARHGIEIAG